MKIQLTEDRSHVVLQGECISVEEYVAMYGEDALSQPSEGAAAIMAEYPDYWSAAISLINSWSRYQEKRKLYINATCSATSHKVLDVIDKHYKGNLHLLKSEIRKLYANVGRMITVFRYYCEKYNLEAVDSMWLRQNLACSDQYKSLRGKCQRRQDSGKMPASLREICHKGP